MVIIFFLFLERATVGNGFSCFHLQLFLVVAERAAVVEVGAWRAAVPGPLGGAVPHAEDASRHHARQTQLWAHLGRQQRDH